MGSATIRIGSSDAWTCTTMWKQTNSHFYANLLCQTGFYFKNGPFLLFQLRGKSDFLDFFQKSFTASTTVVSIDRATTKESPVIICLTWDVCQLNIALPTEIILAKVHVDAVGPDLTHFLSIWQFLESLFSIGQNFKSTLAIFNAIRDILIVTMAKYWTNNIWSHCLDVKKTDQQTDGYTFPYIFGVIFFLWKFLPFYSIRLLTLVRETKSFEMTFIYFWTFPNSASYSLF